MDEQAASAGAGAAGGIVAMGMLCFELALIVLIFASMWKIFVKAGRPGWEGIIPIYNNYVLTTQIIGRPILFFILTLVPCVNFIIMILLMIDLAKAFGKSTGFAIGMIVLPFIFLPMLAFGDATYSGPVHQGA